MKAHYVPSGDFDAVRLLAALAVVSGAAVILSAALAFAMWNGVYLFFVLSLFAARGLGYVGNKLVIFSHLRNPIMAAGLGTCTGIAMFLGIYFCQFLYEGGIDALANLDFFPDYLYLFVNEQVIMRNFSSTGKPFPPLNWTFFVFELVSCAWITGDVWYRTSLQPYCEVCGNWLLNGSQKAIPKSQAANVADALQNDALEMLPSFEMLSGELPESYGQITLEGCLHRNRETESPLLYLSVSEVTRTERGPKYQHRVAQVEVSADEIATLASRCPGIFG